MNAAYAALIGALIGAVISAATSIITLVIQRVGWVGLEKPNNLLTK